MKTSLFMLTLLLLVSVTVVLGKKAESGAAYSAASFWPQHSTVTVYFVRGLFTSEQTKVLKQTLEDWTKSGTTPLKFSFAGETGGLIDCLGCLTITRHELYSNGRRQSASFNRLRSDYTGQLLSAWIGFDNTITDSQRLKSLLIQVIGADHLPRTVTPANASVPKRSSHTTKNPSR